MLQLQIPLPLATLGLSRKLRRSKCLLAAGAVDIQPRSAWRHAKIWRFSTEIVGCKGRLPSLTILLSQKKSDHCRHDQQAQKKLNLLWLLDNCKNCVRILDFCCTVGNRLHFLGGLQSLTGFVCDAAWLPRSKIVNREAMGKALFAIGKTANDAV